MDFGFQGQKQDHHEAGTEPKAAVVNIDIGGSDFWDLGPGDQPEALGFPVVQKKDSILPTLIRAGGYGLLLAMVVFAGAVIVDDSILDALLSQQQDEQVSAPVRDFKPAPVQEKVVVKAQPAPVKELGNPYWELDNSTRVEPQARTVWTELEEVVWDDDLQSDNPWHRYRAALEVSEYQMSGSERVLWRLLKDPKLWIRMRSVAGLADFGVPLSLGVMREAIQKARSDVLWRYLKRFIEESTPGERYMMRGLIRFVGAKSRYVILRSLVHHRDVWTAVYLTAALKDPDPRIAGWVRRLQRSRPWLFKEYQQQKAQPKVVVRQENEELQYEKKKLEGGFDEEAWREWDALYR